jgi:cell division protein FtsI (penicillin-binding protein 3)
MAERRLLALAGIVLLWGSVVLGRLISLQLVHHQHFLQVARDQQESDEVLSAPRGDILDRTGQPLALSVPVRSVIVNPRQIDPENSSNLLSRLLHMDREDVRARIERARAGKRGYLALKRRISEEEYEAVRSQPVDYIHIEETSQRKYPNGPLAAHVLGGVDFEEKGNAGIEKALDKDLRGTPGRALLVTDTRRRAIESQVQSPARPGASLTLTIDLRTQFVAERELAAAAEAHRAVSGSVVVLDPRTGDIIALASYPAYDPNMPPVEGDDPRGRLNHAVSVPFEPGSVFKVMTLSAALETTDLRPESPINCHGGVLSLPGRVIHDSHAGMGIVPMAEVLARSSNIGAIMVGMRVGQENMYDYVRRFGFGQRTGITLPAESPGKLRKLSGWGTTSLASVSMGQEVSVTTLQLAQAAGVIASGGLLVKPRLVRARDGKPVPLDAPIRAIKAETALTMREMMLGVVEEGTGKRAKLSGYSVGGKTGSAQIFDYETKHYLHSYNGSFLGFAPLGNPALVVVVTLNGTHGESGFGGAAAAPVFRAVAGEALRVLDVPKDRPEQAPKQLLAKVMVDAPPDDSGSGMPNILEDADDSDGAIPAGPRTPNFRGMTLRAVLTEAQARGLAVVTDGTGTVRRQDPQPGAALPVGARIKVVLAR